MRLTEVYRDTFYDIATLENATHEFLKFCSERTELFVPANLDNSFKFFHRSFFEYFYSKHIVIRSKDSKEMLEQLKLFDIDSEIFELTLARLKQETQDKYIALVSHIFDVFEGEPLHNEARLVYFNMLILFFQVVDEATFNKRFVDLIITNSEFVIKNVGAIKNQEIIQSVIERTKCFAKVLAIYENVAYQDILRCIKGLNITRVRFVFDRVKTADNPLEFGLSLRRFLVTDEPQYFYPSILFAQYDFITILKNIRSSEIKLGVPKKSRQLVWHLINLYDSLDDENKNIFNKIFVNSMNLDSTLNTMA